MTSIISDVISGLRTLIQSTLGSDYSRLTHEFHIDKNVFMGASKRWGLVPTTAPSAVGNNRAVSVDLTFEIILTDEYISNEMEEQTVVDKLVALFGTFEDLWKQLALQKALVSQHARLLDGFSISNVVQLEEERIIAGYGTFFVRVQIPY